MTEPVRLLNLDTVAERLAVSRRTVEKLIAAGELRTVRFGRAVRVTEQALAQLVAARERRRVA
jgi:excisionase family DNA binding protein